MTIALRLKKELKVPISAKCISPNVFAGKPTKEIAELPLWEGNRKRSLHDIFGIEGQCGRTPCETTIYLVGDLFKSQEIGAGMTDGKIQVKGNVGMHLGEEMKGGKIIVEGNVGSWAGCAMRGGIIEIEKNAGDYIGGAYRGSTKGMQGGTIIVRGNAGTEVGLYMRKGLIRINGDVEQFVGIRMRNGTIVVQGNAEGRAGAYMIGGKIILGSHVSSVLPTFTIESVKSKAKAEEEEIRGPFYLFSGDLAEHGKGKLYVSKNKNEHLKGYEALI